MTIKSQVIEQFNKLNLMDSRVPYTHHHDWVRTNSEVVDEKGMGRSQIAQFPADEDELWACCFLQAIAGLTDEQKICSGIDVPLFKECLSIASSHKEDIERDINNGVWR